MKGLTQCARMFGYYKQLTITTAIIMEIMKREIFTSKLRKVVTNLTSTGSVFIRKYQFNAYRQLVGWCWDGLVDMFE